MTLASSRPGPGAYRRGSSDSPASNADGSVVGSVTTARDLVGRATRGIPQVVAAQLAGGAPRLRLASRCAVAAPATGRAARRALTAGGTWVIFESDATDVGLTTARRPDCYGPRDALPQRSSPASARLLGSAWRLAHHQPDEKTIRCSSGADVTGLGVGLKANAPAACGRIERRTPFRVGRAGVPRPLLVELERDERVDASGRARS